MYQSTLTSMFFLERSPFPDHPVSQSHLLFQLLPGKAYQSMEIKNSRWGKPPTLSYEETEAC